MNLDTYTPPVREDGDRLPAKEVVGRPLIVQVREHLTGVKTQFNSDPKNANTYRPEGGEAVRLDIVDLSTNALYIGVLWFNGAIVDSLKAHVGSTFPIKLFYDTPKTGSNAYLNVEALVGPELALAQQWAAANPTTLDRERAARAAHATAPGMPPVPGAPSQPPPWAVAPPTAAAPAPAPVAAPPVPAPTYAPVTNAATAPPVPPTPAPPAPGATAAVDINDPGIQALLAQLAAQNAK